MNLGMALGEMALYGEIQKEQRWVKPASLDFSIPKSDQIHPSELPEDLEEDGIENIRGVHSTRGESTSKRILDYLKDHPGHYGSKELMIALPGVSYNTLLVTLQRLAAGGLIIRHGRSGSYMYCLPGQYSRTQSAQAVA